MNRLFLYEDSCEKCGVDKMPFSVKSVHLLVCRIVSEIAIYKMKEEVTHGFK